MIFSSLEFLCVFLPITYILCLIIPSVKVQNGLLIVASLLFYAYGEPVYVLLMLLSALINYVSAIAIGKMRSGAASSSGSQPGKWVLVLNIIVNIGILGFFKYTGFLVGSVNSAFKLGLSVPQIDLPIGISFFTFQALSYVIDVYRGKVDANSSFFQVLLYICFFPQLIAGPIVKYRDIAEMITDRSMTADQTAAGFMRFICGLSKKVLIANACGMVADSVFAADQVQVNAAVAWIGAGAYLMQIYYDFSGYSDMAIGLGKMFGFQFRENFRYPYAAGSIQEFWRRWHISLSTWFKEYVYIPLGGNRKGKGRTVLNRWIVFFLTGLWHGANWTFVLWGLYHGTFLMLEEFLPFFHKTVDGDSSAGKPGMLVRFLSHIYTVIVVCVGFVIFRADTVSQGFFIIGRMFGGFFQTPESTSFMWQQLTPYFIVMFAAAVIGCGPIRPVVEKVQRLFGVEITGAGHTVLRGMLRCCSVMLLVWCMIRLSGSTYNPFIYFRF